MQTTIISAHKEDMLFRLAAVLYADSNYNVKINTIINKIIESVFLEVNNKELTPVDIIKFCSENYCLTLDDKEIIDLTYKNDNYIFVKNNNTPFIQLKPERFSLIKAKVKNSSIDMFIDSFIEKFYETLEASAKQTVKNSIYKFLYNNLNANISSFSMLLKANDRISTENTSYMQNGHYSDDEKEYINNFLNWDNNSKNKAIFDITSYAIEYCLISNKSDFKNVIGNGISNKVIYLDTNILYRSLGINGEYRQALTNAFLEKCLNCGIKLKVSHYTDKEFMTSINFHVKKLSTYRAINIDPSFFDDPHVNPGIYKFFHKWRAGRSSTNLEFFKYHIFSMYDKFIEKYKVEKDNKYLYNEHNTREKDRYRDFYYSLSDFKRKSYRHELSKTENKRNVYDALNILIIEKMRGTSHSRFLDTSQFFISCDHVLRKWDFSRNSTPPVVLLPTQLMSVILRYSGRSDDDYKSFVSFINLKSTINVIDDETLHVTCAAINDITMDLDQQRIILSTVLEDKIKGNLREEKNTHILYEDVRKRAAGMLEKKVEEAIIQATEAIEQVAAGKALLLAKENEINNLKKDYESQVTEVRTKYFDELHNRYADLKAKKAKVCARAKVEGVLLYILIYILFGLLLFLLYKSFVDLWNFIEPIIEYAGFVLFFLVLGYGMFFGKKPPSIDQLTEKIYISRIIERRANYLLRKSGVDTEKIAQIEKELGL